MLENKFIYWVKGGEVWGLGEERWWKWTAANIIFSWLAWAAELNYE